VVGLNLNRADFYANEATFQVSQSYGDKTHAGAGSVRENFTEVLQLMADGRLKVEDLVTHRYDFDAAPQAYEQLSNPAALGILLRYPGKPSLATAISLRAASAGSGQLALLGAGNYATRSLLPALKEVQGDTPLRVVVSRQGHQAFLAAERFGAERASTDEADAFDDHAIAGVLITTRHDEHARLTIQALAKGKFPWVEKPLALTFEELKQIETAATHGRLMVGFNRRFAPAATKLHAATADKKGPRRFAAVINAGALDRGHWALDPAKGGGRIVGEACHFIDLARFLVGSPILSVRCTRRDRDGQDGGCYAFEFADGSTGIIDYRTDLPDHMPKEDIEFSGHGWSSRILNWTKLTTEGLGGLSWRSWFVGPRKGQQEALKAYLLALRDSSAASPIPLPELMEVSRAAIHMQDMQEASSVSIS
jgi:predicted dehydrogenase